MLAVISILCSEAEGPYIRINAPAEGAELGVLSAAAAAAADADADAANADAAIPHAIGLQDRISHLGASGGGYFED